MPTLSVTVAESLIRLVGPTPRAVDPANPLRTSVITDWYTDSNGVRQYKITWTW